MLDLKNAHDGIFNIMETNHFKALVHLSLKLRSASDESLKAYLASKLTKEKSENEELRSRNSKLEESLNSKMYENDRLQAELRKSQAEKEKVIEQILLDEQRKLNEFKEQSLRNETSSLREAEAEKKELIKKYEAQIEDLLGKNNNLGKVVKDLSEIRLASKADRYESIRTILIILYFH